MGTIKTISFDCWGTLIKSNKEYKYARRNYIKDLINKESSSDYFLNKIDQVISDIKYDIIKISETQGLHFDKLYIYQRILNDLNVDFVSGTFTKKQLDIISNELDKLFLEHHPTVIDDFVLPTLEILSKNGYKMYLCSNTLLMTGNIMTQVLQKLGIAKYISGYVYSDELKVCKPNLKMFKAIHEMSGNYTHEIVHIGDNRNTDFIPSDKYGFKSILLTDPTKFKNIPELIKNIH